MKKSAILLLGMWMLVPCLLVLPGGARPAWAEIPDEWWTRQNVALPQNSWIQDGTLVRMSDALDQLYLGRDYRLTGETEILNLNHWEPGSALYDGRLLSSEEFRDLEERHSVPEAVTLYGFPTVDRGVVLRKVEFGHRDTGQLSQADRVGVMHGNYVALAPDGLGGTILRTWHNNWSLAFDVGDERGMPLIDFDGTLLQPEKFPRVGDRVRILVQNNVVVRMVKNPPALLQEGQPEPGPSVGTELVRVGKIDAARRLIWKMGRQIHLPDGTQLFDSFGLPIDRESFETLLAPGAYLQVEGPQEGDTGQIAQVVELLDNPHTTWPARPVNRYIVTAYDAVTRMIATIETWERSVALDAEIVESATGEAILLEEVTVGALALVTHQWNQAGEDYPFGDVVLRLEQNAGAEEPGQVQREWESQGRLARIEEGVFGRKVLFSGGTVQVDAETVVLNRRGLPMDASDLLRGEQVYLEVVPTSEPGVVLARRVGLVVAGQAYANRWEAGLYEGQVDRVEGDRIYLRGGEWTLAQDATIEDESGAPLAAADLAGGSWVWLRGQETTTGSRVVAIGLMQDNPQAQPYREEERTFYALDQESARLLFAGARAQVIAPPRGQILGRQGEAISLDELRRVLELEPQTQVVVVTRTSQTGELFATLVRIYNYDRPWEEQVPEGASVGRIGGFDGQVLQLVDGFQPWVAFDAEVVRGDGLPTSLGQIESGTPLRIRVVDAPPGTPTPFGSVVTRIVVNPQSGQSASGMPIDTGSGEIEGTVEEIDHERRTLVLQGPKVRIDPPRTEVLDQDRQRIAPEELAVGDLLAINFVSEYPYPRATRVLRLNPGQTVQERSDVITGRLLDYDEAEGLLRIEGPTLSVPESTEIRDQEGSLQGFESIEPGDVLRLAVVQTGSGSQVTRLKVMGGDGKPVYGGGGLEITSTFPAPEEAGVATSTTVEITFNEQVGNLLADENLDFGLFPTPPEFGDLEISRDGRTVLAEAELEEDTVYQLFVASARFGLFTMEFTTGDQMPSGGIRGRIALPADLPFGAIALQNSGIYLLSSSTAVRSMTKESIRRATSFDEAGEYRFEHLADGQYYVTASVTLKLNQEDRLDLAAYFDADGDGEPDPVTVLGAEIQPVDLTVRLPEPLQVRQTFPSQGAVTVGLEPKLEITFSRPLRLDYRNLPMIDGSIFPQPLSGSFRRDDLTVSEDGRTISLTAKLAAGTTYSLLIRKAESADGLALDRPEVLVFTTGAELPAGIVEGRLALPDVLPPDRMVRTPAVVALVPFRDYDALNPSVEDLAIAGALSSDGRYAFTHVPAGRYVVTAFVEVALPSFFRMPSRGLRPDYQAFAQESAFGQETPAGYVDVRYYGFSQNDLGQARADVRPDIRGVDLLLQPQDVRRAALRVVSVAPGNDVLQEAPGVLDLALQFSEPLVVKRGFVDLDASMRPVPRSGSLMERLVIEDEGRRVVFRGLELEQETTYRFTLASARAASGQELAEPFALTIRTAGAEEVVFGSVAGTVDLVGDEISEAGVYLYDPGAEGLEALAGAVVEPDGTYAIDEVVTGVYNAYAKIQTVGGQDLLIFHDADGDGTPDVLTVDLDGVQDIDFHGSVQAAPGGEGTGTGRINSGAAPSLDLDQAAGDQGQTTLKVEAGEAFQLTVYGRGMADVTGLSISVSFDTTQVAFVDASQDREGEVNLLETGSGAVALFLPVRLRSNVAEFGGAILSPTEGSAADGDGLLGVFHFTTLDGYTGANMTLEQVVFNALGGVRDTVVAQVSALVVPPIDLEVQVKGIVSFDFNPAAGDDELFHLGGVTSGQEVEVEVYLNGVENLTNYSATVLYDPRQLSYVTFTDGDFLNRGGGMALGLPPLLTDNTVEFGAAILGPAAATAVSGNGLIGRLVFSTTESFSETELLLVEYSTKAYGSQQNKVETSIFGRLTTRDLGSSAEAGAPSADFSGDGTVDFTDFFMFADAFGVADPDLRYDLDESGSVDFGDFFLFADAFGGPVGKLVLQPALTGAAGRLELRPARNGDGLAVELVVEETRLRGYGAVVEYDPAAFRLVGIDDARSALRSGGEALLMKTESPGQVLLLGSGVGTAPPVSGVLAELRFAPLVPAAAGWFRVREGLVRRADGQVVRPCEVGQAEVSLAPMAFALHPNYPNPFNPATLVPYELPRAGMVRLEIYDLLGQKVRTLVKGIQAAGLYHVAWDGQDEADRPVGAGVYLCRLQADGQTQVHRLLLLK